MKSSIIYSLAFMALLIAACRKNDNPRVPDFQKVPLPVLTLDSNSGTKISGTDPLSFEATFSVDVFHKNGEYPKSFDIVVIKNNDKSNPKVIQAGVTTFPTNITVTGQMLTDLFGADIVFGDAFLVGADVITQADQKWEAFPNVPGGITYAPGIANEAGSTTTLRFAAPCVFDHTAYTSGDYEVVVDEWEDYAPGDIVPVTKIDETHYSFKYAASNANPIIMVVDPATNAITVAPTMYGDYDGLEVTATGVPGDDSEADPCDVSFSVKLNHVYSGGDLGDYVIKLKKVQ
jgi:hypothetical protein